jgi:predicted flap endonuclease-1-like 5' DNA nuclease
MTAYDIDKSGRLVRNSPRAGAGKGRYVLGDHDGSRGDPRNPKSVAADLFEADRNDPGFAVNRYDPRDVSKNGRRQPRAQQGVATTDDDGSLGGMDGYRERAMRAEGKRVIVRRDGSLTVTTDLFDPALGERTDRQSPGRARRSDARPYGMDGASMGTQERLDRARRAREGPDDDDDEADENGSNSNSIDPRGIVQPLPARPAPRARARARLAPLSSASKRAAAAATTGRRVVRSKSSLPPGESASPPRSGDDGTVAKKGEPLSGLKGMGPGSVAALAEIGVYTVDDLAAMSDDAVDEAKRNRPRLKLSHLRKVARAAVEPDR